MFISFEGIDYSGKSTQCARAIAYLEASGRQVQLLREPGGTTVSEAIRDVLLDARYQGLHPVAELLLFSAARAQLVNERIRPALDRGTVVVADRFLDSTTAYQGYGRGIDLDAILHVHALATAGLLPDLTFFIDVPVDVSFSRRHSDAGADRMESADPAFFERVREGYRTLARESRGRVRIVDGTRSEDDVARDVREAIDALEVQLAARATT